MFFDHKIKLNGEWTTRPALLVKANAAVRQVVDSDGEITKIPQDEVVVFLSFADAPICDLSGEVTSTPHIYIDAAVG